MPNGKKAGWKLIDSKTGRELLIGETVTTFRGETATLTDWMPPLHEASTGRACIRMADDAWEHPFFPSVINAQIVRQEDDIAKGGKPD